MCVFVYDVDTETEPARDRFPMTFVEVYLGQVTRQDFRRNPRGELGTRTATLHREGIEKLRRNWIFRLSEYFNPFLYAASLGMAFRARSKKC